MPFNPGIAVGQIVSNDDIHDIFQCSPQGGMRRSNATNSLVIVSDPQQPLYQDEWHENVLHYTGMGMSGDQDIDFQQNKTLKESKINSVDVFLFEKLGTNKYLFQGQVELAGKPYQDNQPGADGRIRRVWIFPVKLVNQEEPSPLPDEIWRTRQETARREARRLSDDELRRRAVESQGPSSERPVTSKQRSRNEYVAEYVKRRAGGRCELCGNDAPFLDKSGQPFLEEHHIIWLSRGGLDTIENAVALCPNCHRKMHALDLEQEKKKLRRIV